MKWEIPHTRRPGIFVINSDDILQIRLQPGESVNLLLKYHWLYRSGIDDTTFRLVGEEKSLEVSLDGFQVAHIVQLEREARTSFCTGDGSDNCFDFGKSPRPPTDCLRCRLLDACHRARLGDYRKVRPTQPRRELSAGQTFMLAATPLLIGWALNQYATASDRAERAEAMLRQEQARVRELRAKAPKSPPPPRLGRL